MDKRELDEAQSNLDEAIKRNDRTYVVISRLEQALPVGYGPEGDLRAAIAEAEAQQQATRKALFRVNLLLAAERGDEF